MMMSNESYPSTRGRIVKLNNTCRKNKYLKALSLLAEEIVRKRLKHGSNPGAHAENANGHWITCLTNYRGTLEELIGKETMQFELDLEQVYIDLYRN